MKFHGECQNETVHLHPSNRVPQPASFALLTSFAIKVGVLLATSGTRHCRLVFSNSRQLLNRPPLSSPHLHSASNSFRLAREIWNRDNIKLFRSRQERHHCWFPHFSSRCLKSEYQSVLKQNHIRFSLAPPQTIQLCKPVSEYELWALATGESRVYWTGGAEAGDLGGRKLLRALCAIPHQPAPPCSLPAIRLPLVRSGSLLDARQKVQRGSAPPLHDGLTNNAFHVLHHGYVTPK